MGSVRIFIIRIYYGYEFFARLIRFVHKLYSREQLPQAWILDILFYLLYIRSGYLSRLRDLSLMYMQINISIDYFNPNGIIR